MAKRDKDDGKDKLEFTPLKTAKEITDFLNTKVKANVASTASAAESDESRKAIVYSTGILSLDQYLGCGGLVAGRIFNAWGWEGTGKTLTGLMIGANVQRRGGRTAMLDAEGTYSPAMAKSVGINTDELILVQSTPERVLAGEDYFDMIRFLAQAGVEFILLDSLPALVPSTRMTARINEGQKAAQAQLFSEGFSSITPILNAFGKTSLYVINQMRGVPMQMFGPPDKHTGGNAIKFFETYSLEVRKLEDIVRKVPAKNGLYEDRRIGVRCRGKLHKNKTAPIAVDPIEYTVYFETVADSDGIKYYSGVDVIDDAVSVGIKTGAIQKSGSWLSFGGVKQLGEEKFKDAFRAATENDRSIFDELRDRVLSGPAVAEAS